MTIPSTTLNFLFLSFICHGQPRNLLKRAENCVHAKVAHIHFEYNSLVHEFAKFKGHQDREEHLYANTKEPWVCPVLALVQYLLIFPETFPGSWSFLMEKTNIQDM